MRLYFLARSDRLRQYLARRPILQTSPWIPLLAALVLAGCTGKEVETAIVATEAPRPAVPAECWPDRDPKWQATRATDIPRSENVRREAANEDSFYRLKTDRAVCAAGLREQVKK